MAVRHQGWKLGTNISSDCGGATLDLIGVSTVSTDTWHHVALVIDGTGNFAMLYLDGQLDREFEIAGFCGVTDKKGLLFLDGKQVDAHSVSGRIPPNNPNPFRVGT